MTWVLLSISLLVLFLLISLFLKNRELHRTLTKTPEPDPAMLMMQQQLEALREQTQKSLHGSAEQINQQLGHLNEQLNLRLKDSNQTLQQSQKNVGERLDHASKVVGDLQGKLGKLEEANARLLEVGQDIRGLQEILKTPKLRGSLGEFLLADLLGQILPKENFELQYAFKNNEKVDAVIRIGDRMVSVDSKFPLENFQRLIAAEDESKKKQFRKAFRNDVKKHLEAIATKYIRPDENTYDFALMYVPAENIYYEVIIKDEVGEGDHALATLAMKKRVIPVSPNTLYVYLNTIVLGLKGLHIEKAAQEIMGGLARLSNDLERIKESYRKVGLHLHNAQGSYEDAQNRLGKFSDRMERLHESSGEGKDPALKEEDGLRVLPSGKS